MTPEIPEPAGGAGAARLGNLLSLGVLRVVVFDLDGTLFPADRRAHTEIKQQMVAVASALLGVTPGQARTLMRGYRARYGSSVIGLERHHGIAGRGFLAQVYGRLDTSGVKVDDRLVVEIQRLAAKVPTCILTNSSVSYGQCMARQLRLAPLSDKVYGAESFGYVRKPNPAPFLGLARILTLRPSELVMFDDSVRNLEQAHACGMSTVLVSNGLVPPPDFWDLHAGKAASPPGFVVGACYDLAGFLQAVNDYRELAKSRREGC